MTKTSISGNEIRNTFVEFFKSKGHTFVRSSSLVPGGDATLLFTNAGMVQFKDVFLGIDKRPYKRAANFQKCMRVAGKHNDLEDVGRDDSHHTFFEMLGNWSFGDYYKKEAIQWAWELLTEVWELPKERLYATVFKDEHGEIPTDDEAAQYWLEQPGFNPNHLFYLGRKDNFWEMADTGPSGPCSEIHFDLRPNEGAVTSEILDTDRFIELWNLVFIQYNRIDETHLEPLAAKHVDTGMGLERLVAILQNKNSNYRTDLLYPLIQATQELTGHNDEEVNNNFTPYRVIADHGRASTFLIADGVIPGNLGRNYVCRMIIRRAYRYGGKIGLKEPFLAKIADVVIDNYSQAYPELKKNREIILDTITKEEEQFQQTLEKATGHLEILLDELEDSGGKVLDGEKAANLYTTYGMPFEITQDIARERGLEVDETGFNSAMEKHKMLSGGNKALGRMDAKDVEVYRQVYNTLLNEQKIGQDGVKYDPYSNLTFQSEVLALVSNGKIIQTAEPNTPIEVVLPETHFYIEAGGQVSDTGIIKSGKWLIEINDIKRPAAGIIIHKGIVREGNPKVGDKVLAQVDIARRRDIMRNHTATHLLHAALHKVLGEHARQAGSLVAPDRLRFDFTHPAALSPQEIDDIEALVNHWIYEDHPLFVKSKPLQQALDEGATALFGEKYAEIVRTISMGKEKRFSYELCGGTHVNSTNEIGIFIITNEGSAAAGIRRIEAVTGRKAYQYIHNRLSQLNQTASLLATQPDLLAEKAQHILDETHELRNQISLLQQKIALQEFEQEISKTKNIKGINVLTLSLKGIEPETLRKIADKFRERYPQHAIGVFGSINNNKPIVIATITKDLTKEGLLAGDLVKFIGNQLGGSGGGKPTLAQAGGKYAEKLDEALTTVVDWIIRQRK